MKYVNEEHTIFSLPILVDMNENYYTNYKQNPNGTKKILEIYMLHLYYRHIFPHILLQNHGRLSKAGTLRPRPSWF